MADETKNETVSDLADLKDIAGDAPEGDASDIAAAADVASHSLRVGQNGSARLTCATHPSPKNDCGRCLVRSMN